MKRLFAFEIVIILVVAGLGFIAANEAKPARNAFIGINPPCPTCGRTMAHDDHHSPFCTHCNH